MGKVDSAAKEYFSDNKKFADLCNAVLFEGEQIISADGLQEQDSTEVLAVFGVDPKHIHMQKWRDLLKNAVIKTTGELCIVLFGLEAQSSVHYAMPVKNMLYDAINYGDQVKQAATKHRDEKEYTDNDEFLSGFKVTDKLTPVITLTVYLGDKEWDAPRNLKEMFPNVDQRLLPFMSDYKANVIVPAEINDFDKFKTDLKQIFEVLSVSCDSKRMAKMLDSDPSFTKLSNDTVRTINDFAGTKIPLNEKGSVVNMCKAWRDQYDSGIQEGRAEGRAEGREEGRLEEIFDSVQSGDYGVERGAQKTNMSIPEFEKAMEAAGYKIPAHA